MIGKIRSDFESNLLAIVAATPSLLEVLAAVRAVGLPNCYVAAGAIRNTVWNALHGSPSEAPFGDIDVVYFDPADAPNTAQQQLFAKFPQYTWDVANQATIHQWQSADAERPISAYTSIESALASWPEKAKLNTIWTASFSELLLRSLPALPPVAFRR